MIFKDPIVFILFPIIAAVFFLYKRSSRSAGLRFSSSKLLEGIKPTFRIAFAKRLYYLRLLAILFFLIALARPRMPLDETKIFTEGIDIVLAIDASGSMLAEDFTIAGRRYNRLDVVKEVVEDFIRMRKADRIGLVAFAARAYTVCPMTLDYDWLIKNLERIRIGSIEDGTAIGSAISSSLNRLKETKAKSKIIILLTDGVNNTGNISPLLAAEAAKALGVKVYTVGAGSQGPVPYPIKNSWGKTVYENVRIDMDEDLLREIARITGALYFRATNTQQLKDIYKEIDKLEKTPVEEKGFRHYKELFSGFLLAGLIILLFEILISNTILRKIP